MPEHPGGSRYEIISKHQTNKQKDNEEVPESKEQLPRGAT